MNTLSLRRAGSGDADNYIITISLSGGDLAVTVHHNRLIILTMVGNVISTTPQFSPTRKIVGKFKKDSWASINNYITWHP